MACVPALLPRFARLRTLKVSMPSRPSTLCSGNDRTACRAAEVKLLGYAGPLVNTTAEYPDFATQYFQLLASLLVLGAMMQRQVIVPPIDCDSAWITKGSVGRLGIKQVQCCNDSGFDYAAKALHCVQMVLPSLLPISLAWHCSFRAPVCVMRVILLPTCTTDAASTNDRHDVDQLTNCV